jgi:hypothetical protein
VTDNQQRDELIRGLLYAHNRANANTAQVHEANAAVQALIEVLEDAGVLDRAELEQRRRDARVRLQREYVDRGMAVAVQEFEVSKYEFTGGPVIDCEARLPLCRAACCKLPLALSAEDVREGVLTWDTGRPYMMARGTDHYCVHLDRQIRRCGVYGQRPIPCRGYDCRGDRRIWLDFDARIINPQINDPDWPASLPPDAADTD